MYLMLNPLSMGSQRRRDAGVLWYGVEWDLSNSAPECTRIGNMDLHRALPVQESMTAVLLQDDGSESYTLDPADWTRRVGGTASNLDGTDGQVMVRVPGFYFRAESEGTVRRWMISPYALDGFDLVPSQYISAYEAALDRANGKLASVVNAAAQYRGGANQSAWDAQSNTMLGKPVTSTSRTGFRSYARARGAGWEMYNYPAHRALMILFVTEYATRNSQESVNYALDSDGYRQGGLGYGCANLNWSTWSAFNGNYPVLNCGLSDSLGTATGEVLYDMPSDYGTLTTQANRYRGIENPFGHLWKNADGINVQVFADGETDPSSYAWVSDDPATWNDSDYTGYSNAGSLPRSNGYIREMLAGHVVPANTTGAGSTTYWCDYFYTSLPSSGESLRTVLFGGSAHSGSYAGLGYSTTNASPSLAHAPFGSRLCYLPA